MRSWSPLVLACLTAVIGCADRKAPAANPQTAAADRQTPAADRQAPAADRQAPAAPSCAERAAELRVFLAAVVDPAAELEPPWPTGDPEFDRRVDEARDYMRELAKPRDPGARLPLLSEGVDTRPDEEMYRDCPQGLAALEAVATAEPFGRAAAFVRIADAVEECGCQVDIPWLKVVYYLLFRSPD